VKLKFLLASEHKKFYSTMSEFDADENQKRKGNQGAVFRVFAIAALIPFLTSLFLGMNPMISLSCLILGVILISVIERNPLRTVTLARKSVLITWLIQLGVSSSVYFTFGDAVLSSKLSGLHIESQSYQLETHFKTPVKTMSVILPCANEGIYAVKTARSIGERTPVDVLEEIIVVDDGSTPPLEEYFNEHGKDVLDKYPVRFVRHETFTGLINAKQQGGDRAKGDVLAFLDCHVLPRDYGVGKSWVDGIMTRIAGNYRRIVVPSITDLDADKWDEIGRPNGIAKCYLSFNVDFLWFDSEDDYVPIMSGGLLAMSRQWWKETGGYDHTFIGWGGENIDQSLRTWQCHGEIVQGTDSHVAHMWRTNDKPQTKAKYTVPEGSVNRNRYAAALGWFDEYIEKVHEFSIFSKYASPTTAPLPNVDSMMDVRNRLQCKPFQAYIDRFSKLYFHAGVLPAVKFRIRDVNTNLCLARRNSGNRENHNVVAAACSTDDPAQLWHRGNRDGDKCCSGLRSYDSMYCLSGGRGGAVSATECNTFGRNDQQFVFVTSEGEVKFGKSNTCVSLAASTDDVIVQTPCDTTGFRKEFTTKPVENNDGLGHGWFQIVEATTGMCWTSFSPVGGDADPGSIELTTCDSRSIAQHFKLVESFVPGQVQIRTWENLCLDAADGKRILAYVCYDNTSENRKQVFRFDEATRTIRNNYHPTCVALPDSRVKLTADFLAISITGCITWGGVLKAEQVFSKVPSLRKIANAFLIKSDQWCISGNKENDRIALLKCPASPVDETDDLLWSFEASSRIRNRGADKCLDGNDHKQPILYPCYSSENDNQEWSDPGNRGHIKNARAQMCLDYHPKKERSASVSPNCNTGSKWEEYEPVETTEMRIYKQTKAKLSAPVHG
jgi:GT2 family glycosyltransferase